MVKAESERGPVMTRQDLARLVAEVEATAHPLAQAASVARFSLAAAIRPALRRQGEEGRA